MAGDKNEEALLDTVGIGIQIQIKQIESDCGAQGA